jgi:hypothetical protein
MSQIYTLWNGPAADEGVRAVLLTGTAIKTHIQVHLGDDITKAAKILGWGVSFNGDPTAVIAADAAVCELLTTGLIPATAMVAQAAVDIAMLEGDQVVPADNLPFALGTGETAYGDASVTEGTVTASSTKDCRQVQLDEGFSHYFPHDARPNLPPGEFLRLRITAPITMGAIAWVQLEASSR